MARTIQKPVTAPYSSEVHTAAWEAWDEHIAEFPERNTELCRIVFMDGFVRGLKA